jgi:glycine/sarcosine N-methyltransferase
VSDPSDFYNALASSYHLIYTDWEASIKAQAAALDTIIHGILGPGKYRILDCAAGIGTQTIGLAKLGHSLAAADISEVALARAEKETSAAGLTDITFRVSDFHSLLDQFDRQFDVVLACDNSLPHLLTEASVREAILNFRSCLVPGGLLLISTRNYDQVLSDRPPGTMPKLIDNQGVRRVTFQVWEWLDQYIYSVDLFLLVQTNDQWDAMSVTTKYRAWTRDQLASLFKQEGIQDIAWHMPPESGFFQPVLTGRVGLPG